MDLNSKMLDREKGKTCLSCWPISICGQVDV
jgi:hypothetical protein